jgi:predicted CoA-binding protein
MPLTNDADIAALLTATRTIALVGASPKPNRASNEVMAALLAHGYRVVPVNPQHAGETIHGQTVVASLAEINVPIDLVDVFRRAEDMPPVVADAIAVGAKALWMQLGIVNTAAAATAEAAGLTVVMDRCTKVDVMRLRVPRVG